MGKRGPAPTPTNLRLLHGARERDTNRNEPVARTGAITAPEGMSPEVKRIFYWAVRELEHMGIASPADRDSVACYAEAVEKHRQASALLARTPVLVKGIHGNLVRNPALIVQRDAAQQIRQFAQEFGLTPSARARIDNRTEDSDGDNPFAVTP
jgi:P27 family predicted phage terminase small subunit